MGHQSAGDNISGDWQREATICGGSLKSKMTESCPENVALSHGADYLPVGSSKWPCLGHPRATDKDWYVKYDKVAGGARLNTNRHPMPEELYVKNCSIHIHWIQGGVQEGIGLLRPFPLLISTPCAEIIGLLRPFPLLISTPCAEIIGLLRPFPLLISTPCAEVRSVPLESNQIYIYIYGMHVLGHPFFGSVQYMFSNLAVFFWTWGHEKCGRLACVFPGPCDDNFYGPGWIWLDLKEFFWTERVFIFDTGFFFLGPCTCFVDLASIGVGGISIVICAGCFLDLDVHVFLTCHRVGGI